MRKLLAISCLAALSGCAIIVAPNDGDVRVKSVFSNDAVVGDGRVTSERRAVANLEGIDVSGSMHVDVRVGPQASLQVEADSNLLPLIRTEADGSNLRIWIEGSVRSNNGIRVVYTAPRLTQIRSNGSGRLVVGDLNGEPLALVKNGSGATQLSGRVSKLDMQLNGSGSIDASALQTGNANVSLSGSGRLSLGQVNAEAFNVQVRGSGDLQASGSAASLNARVHGSGGANLMGLTSQRADLSTNGSGDISALVKQALVANTFGSGRITVYGNPAQRNISGKHVQLMN